MKKEKAVIIAWVVIQNFSNPTPSTKAVQAGLLFSSQFPEYLKKKQTCILVILEQNTTVKTVADTMVIFLKMDQSLLENVIATMACV